MDILPGRPFPMGATLEAGGTNFAVFASRSEPGAVSVCLYDDHGTETRLPLPDRDGPVWHGYVPGVGAGQRYAFRCDGPWRPAEGLWGNGAKVLLDPYGLAFDGTFDGDSSTVAHAPGDRLAADGRDSALHVPRSVVVDPAFDWGHDAPPRTSFADTVVYETHVRGVSMRHPDVPDAQKGTYAGLGSQPIVEHLTSLGITAVELQPVHQFLSRPLFTIRGLSNYWGYDTIGFLAPHAAYSSTGSRGQQVNEFKSMVKALHSAGLEVIIDVVFNHTVEGDADGPTVAFRGLDNLTYYRVDTGNAAEYDDLTGTGNTLDAGDPEVLRLVMTSLRYWVTDMHVDGFRFDLASVLARQLSFVDRFSAFLDLVYEDPIVSQVKVIAEPWDLGSDGYQLGHFPAPWSEWNDRFRGGVRDFWRGAAGAGELATRLSGSSDVFQAEGLTPEASINFVTCHDGFTLADLVAYNGKHNEANGESNRDGTDDNRSWNCGAEGPTTDSTVLDLRARQQRNFLATLMLSQGVPMLLGGDETGRTQGGNNNAYCQDNETTWYDWNLDQRAKDLLAFTRSAIALRRTHPSLRRTSFFSGQTATGSGRPDVLWLSPAATSMSQQDWAGVAAFSMWINGDAIGRIDEQGKVISDETLMIMVNGTSSDVAFSLPPTDLGATWVPLLDTSTSTGRRKDSAVVPAEAQLHIAARSVVLLKRPP